MKKHIKLFALVALTVVHTACIAQETSREQNQIISQFSLYANDSRGTEFRFSESETSADCSQSFMDVKTAIESVFNAQLMTDYTIICIEGVEKDYFDRGLSIMELVDIYIEIESNN